MKHQSSEPGAVQVSGNGGGGSRLPVESTKSTSLHFRDYLREKRLHLRYLLLAFKLRYWSCELIKPSNYVCRLHDLP